MQINSFFLLLMFTIFSYSMSCMAQSSKPDNISFTQDSIAEYHHSFLILFTGLVRAARTARIFLYITIALIILAIALTIYLHAFN